MHSPTPWYVFSDSKYINDANCRSVAHACRPLKAEDGKALQQGNAAHIVSCVNALSSVTEDDRIRLAGIRKDWNELAGLSSIEIDWMIEIVERLMECP